MRGAAVVVVASLSGCVEHRVLDVPIDAYTFEYGFMVLSGEGGVTRVSSPFGVGNGALTFGSLPAYDLTDAETGMMLIGLPAGALREAAPLFDDARAERLALEPFQQPPPYYEQDATGEYLSLAIPEGALVLKGDFEGELTEAAPPELSLRIPIATEQCSRMGPGGLAPFGSTSSLLPPEETPREENDIFFVRLIDPDLVVVMTPRSLHLLRAGEAYDPIDVTLGAPGNRLQGDIVPAPNYTFTSFALDRDAGRVWLSGGAPGFLMELSVGSELTLERTVMVPDMTPAAVTILPDGSKLLVGFDGEVAIYDGDLTPMPSVPLDEGEGMYRAHATGDARHPYFASSYGGLHVFDAIAEAWSSFDVPTGWLRSTQDLIPFTAGGLASSRKGDLLELWAAGNSGLLLRKLGDEAWQPYPIHLPPRYDGCASEGTYPELVEVDHLDAIQVVGDDLFVSVRSCTTLLQVRRDSPCVALVSVTGFEPVYSQEDLQALDILGDTIVLAGEEGLVFRGTLVRR